MEDQGAQTVEQVTKDKKLFKDYVLVILVVIAAVVFGSLFSSPTIELIKVIATPLTLWLIAQSVTKKLAEQERQITETRNKQEALKSYLTQITTFIVDRKLSQLPHDNPVTQAAKALTISLLLELDADRTRQLTKFLYDSKLTQNNVQENQHCPTLLKRSELRDFDLSCAMLTDADLSNSILNNARLIHANLQGAIFAHAILRQAILAHADLMRASFFGADLRGAVIVNSNLRFTVLVNANLMVADLRGSILSGAVFKDAQLLGANLSNTMIKLADLRDAKYTKDHPDIPDTIFPENFNPEAAGMKQINNIWRYDWNRDAWFTSPVEKEDTAKKENAQTE